MKILNLYAGLGGSRKLWGSEHQITAVEINKDVASAYKFLYPNDNVIICDAHEYLLENYNKFDFIWASPPCQSHSKMVKATNKFVAKYPDMNLWQEIIFLQHFCKKSFWVVENVIPYYKVFLKPNAKISRHLFWANFTIQGMINEPKSANIGRATKKELQDNLGIYYHKNLRVDTVNTLQVYRNCVHPKIGLHIIEQLRWIIETLE